MHLTTGSILSSDAFTLKVHPELYLGAIAISVIPLLADYVSHKSRGTCAAILVFMSSIGALSSAFINFTILDKIEASEKIYVQYAVISILILLIGIFYSLFCLKKGNSYYTKK